MTRRAPQGRPQLRRGMIVTKKHLPRRTVLRGLGATIALPLLDGMIPAFTATRLTAAAPVRRFGAVYMAMGMNMPLFTQDGTGDLQITPILQPIGAFKDRLTVVRGLGMANADSRQDGTGQHSRIGPCWLTGVRPKKTEGADFHAGVSMDQILAAQLGQETQLASIELAAETPEMLGSCEFGYTCAYTSTMAWKTPTTPLPMEVNPRNVFERMFGAGDSTDARARLAQHRRDRSLLDAVSEDVAQLRRDVGESDRAKLGEFMDSLRDVERRIQNAEEQGLVELPVVEKPVGIPASYEEHLKLLFDLLTLAYQTDLTRISTFMLARELSLRTYPEIGVPDPHHPLSHHQNNPEQVAKLGKLNVFHLTLFSHFLERMAATQDGDGSLLDHTLLLFGSGMSDSNLHLPRSIPTIVVGGKEFGLRGGRHIRVDDTSRTEEIGIAGEIGADVPLCNLQLTLMDRMGVRVDSFGDSSGHIDLTA
ncbi:MAG: DUF1552 domain-containing protein [Acidimicrobiia bacterium]|nr:DUF1552 domain-containing protein [Acidimicrobiia bacterium]